MQCIKEQPQSPFTAVVADFQQLQPLGSGEYCRRDCEHMQTETLGTVYRTDDAEHLLFQNRIRSKQPDKEFLRQYFGDRHWDGCSLEECVKDGMQIAEETKKQFLWLTCTNKGYSEVCEAALRAQGITDEQLDKGYPCNPASKSNLPIIAKKGILAD